MNRHFVLTLVAASLVLSIPPSRAFTPRREHSRLDALARSRDGGVIAGRAVAVADLDATDALRRGWNALGGSWKAWIDERSGLPSLAIGHEDGWPTASAGRTPAERAATLAALETRARQFLTQHAELLGSLGDQLVLDDEASGPLGDDVWQVTFRQVVGGVPVEGARYDFQVSRGNLVAFGASRVAPVVVPTGPALSVEQAWQALDAYLGPDATTVVQLEPAGLHLVPVDPRGLNAAPWAGARGRGYAHLLVWRFTFRVPGEIATWVAEVDAHDGRIVSMFDDTRYQRIKGGVYPVGNDGNCAEGGCIEPDLPMPFADYTVDGGPTQFTADGGVYECSTLGSTIRTRLIGQYVRVSDNCGAVSEITTCDEDLDLGLSPGTDCQVGNASAGDTRAARTTFYHINRMKQKGRAWLPSNTWLQGLLTDNVNINSTCNAGWNGTVNFFKSGGGCNNTGEIAAVVDHEWGHGLDQNDGGGFDNPSEAYADVTAFIESRQSCMGPGFLQSGTCSGYGDTCLSCSGVRDMDWDQRVEHTPATPSGFLTAHCPNGDGPCGKEVHCEAYVAGEAMWDLAVRDLPAMGLDPDTAWQLVDKLWYLSRQGSGGDAYNCSLPSSDGCGTGSWFHKLRLVDDDDGDLNNGTPHAAAIFAAFDRHDIACGTVSSASNSNTSSCPALQAPVITTASGITNGTHLEWDPVTDAASYTVLRNELGCNRGQIIVGSVAAPATIFEDHDLGNDFPVYYRVQATAANSACDGPVSTCVQVTPLPLAGKVRFDRATYGCSHTIGLRVTDANVGASTVTVSVSSDSEPTPESVILTETSPGAYLFEGQIVTTSGSAAPDGLLSVADGDALTAQYIDANDGEGGINVVREHQATADCVNPAISNVQTQDVTGTSARITWTTDEAADSVAVWDDVAPPSQMAAGAGGTTSHEVVLDNLQECTNYFYEVQSTDPAGNATVDDNGGTFHRFATLGDFGMGLQPCHAGQVNVDQSAPSCSQVVTFHVTDIDLNGDPGVAESTSLLVASTTEVDPEIVTATETGPNTSVFAASIATASGAPVHDGVLQTADGDVLTVTYQDADDGTGLPALSFATTAMDCAGPRVTGLHVESITNARATVRWTTDEPADSVVEWGPAPALGQTTSASALVTDHAVVLNQFDLCQEVGFRIHTTDGRGNETTSDDLGTPFRFSTWDIPGLYWRDNFENGNTGWTLNGEWEIGPPQGLGGSTGAADPTTAYNNDNVLGDDLSGLGAFPGDYEPNVSETAQSPPQDASSWTHTKLIVHRRLNTASGDSAFLTVSRNGVINIAVFQSSGSEADATFQQQSFDVSSLVDGAPSTFIVFRQDSNGSGQSSGWNVDDVIFKDGSLPDYAACGGCTAAPSFAGAVSAVDNDACGASGVTVSWQPAVSWGTGSAGTYALYRDTSPGFTPSPANLVISGLTATSYDDVSAPVGQSLYYVVRAENDEGCSSGPNNGGLTDDNTAAVAVQDGTTAPDPGAIGTLMVNLAADVHVRLDWGAASGATTYRVYRSDSPMPGTFGVLDETGDLLYEDLGEATNPTPRYYSVVGVNACGQE